MSDILIKNMEIPKDSKYVDVRIFRDGWATTASVEEPFYKKMDVVEVPTPHGRLVDCDEVFQRLKRFSIANPYLQEQIDSDLCALVRWFGTAPTIIEGEGKHESHNP